MNNRGWIGILVVVLVAVLIIGMFGYGLVYVLTGGEETIAVKIKWTKIVDGTEKYRITADDGQVFVIKDSLFHGQFESASIYTNMEEGETYRIRTQGFRFGFLSDFKKITEATKI